MDMCFAILSIEIRLFIKFDGALSDLFETD